MAQMPFFHQVAHDLLHEQGVTLRLAVDGLGQRARHLGAGDRHQHPLHLRRAQTPQQHTAKLGPTPELGQRRRQGVAAVDLDVAVGADDQQPRTGEIAGEVLQQVERALVGPVQVLQHQQQGLHGGGVAQEARDRLQQPPAVLFGVARGTRLDGQPLADFTHDASKVGSGGAEVGPESLRLAGQDVGAQRLDEGEVGQG